MFGYFKSAVTGADGSTDPGYFAMFASLYGAGFSSACILVMGAVALLHVSAPETMAGVIQSSGIALGAVAGSFATIIGAVGLFRAGDKPRAETQTITSTITTAPKTSLEG